MEIKDKDYRYHDNSTGKRIGYSILLYFILFCIGCMLSLIASFFVTPEKASLYMFTATLGACIWIIAIVTGLIEGVSELRKRNLKRKRKYDKNGRRIWSEPKEEKTYLVVEFVKAKYNKYCPKIDWTDKL